MSSPDQPGFVIVRALYRAPRQLELSDNVKSEWKTDKAGPARRVYKLTANGDRHLEEWGTVLEHVSKSMTWFVKETGGTLQQSGVPKTVDAASDTRLVEP